MAQRWEQVLGLRDRVSGRMCSNELILQMDQVEIVSWNDYGESTYVGPITGDMPAEARRWANADCGPSAVLS
jgi:glucan endo-1,3-alpha-glucosidase